MNKQQFNVIFFFVLLLPFPPLTYAFLIAQTVKTIHGSHPSLSSDIEQHIDDLALFGLNFEGLDYYGNEEVDNIPLVPSYPFINKFKVANIKQPDSNQYVDLDGDQLDFLSAVHDITMTWYYTNAQNKLVQFTPKTTDTFCSLAQSKIVGPYKVKLAADLLLFSKFGDPDANEYPNELISAHPAKTYSILKEAGVCYAKPVLLPTAATASAANQWDKKNGFLTQSVSEFDKNFPTTGFYGAQFDLLLNQQELASNYDWKIIQGSELATVKVNPTSNKITVAFDTDEAKDTGKAWQYVIGSGTGYKVLIQGHNKTTNYNLNYMFTLTKWFSGYNKANIGMPKATIDTAPNIAKACKTLNGHYRISYPDEVSNATSNVVGTRVVFTREIGTLLGEWGDPSQTAYPNSWAPAATQSTLYKRIWLYDPNKKAYCDLHTYNAIYHCSAETDRKAGICTAVAESDTN